MNKKVIRCQFCKSKSLNEILSLGRSGLCDSLIDENTLKYKKEVNFPLNLIRCKKCDLVQLDYIVKNDLMFHKDYPYRSDITPTLKNNLTGISDYIQKNFNYNSNSLVVDIGSNDGTLLSGFKKKNYRVLGVEPTNISKIANKKGIKTENIFFNSINARKLKKKYGEASIITATNVFAHVDELDKFMQGVKTLLKKNKGIFLTESHYLVDIVEKLQYDSIYHEHLRFYLLKNLINIFSKYNLKVIDALRIPNYGGSIRVVASADKSHKINKRVKKILKDEKKKGYYNDKIYKKFSTRVRNSKKKLQNYLWKLKSLKKKIVGIGCPGRAVTLLSYLNVDNSILDYIAEQKNSLKLNLYTPTSRIKVINENIMLKKQPDYAFMLSWHYYEDIIKNLRRKGLRSKIIIPLPNIKIVK